MEKEPSVYEEELSETKVTIYPNPTKGMLKVDISGVEKFENAGYPSMILPESCCSSGRVYPNPMKLIYRTDSGMYIMQIVYNGNASSWKIIKE